MVFIKEERIRDTIGKGKRKRQKRSRSGNICGLASAGAIIKQSKSQKCNKRNKNNMEYRRDKVLGRFQDSDDVLRWGDLGNDNVLNESGFLSECLRQTEMRERQGKPRSRQENQRKDLYEKTGIAIQQIDTKMREGQREEKTLWLD